MKNTTGLFHWLPRIISIVAILFISLFALDSFGPGLTIWQQLGGFFMHMIPSFILLGILILAWKREFAGGILFIIVGLVLSPFVFNLNYHRTHSIILSLSIISLITIPFIIVGILFIVSQRKKKKAK
jgi:hypothetical protein